MPVKIIHQKTYQGSLRQRIDAFRQTIKDDEGYTIDELRAMPQFAGNVRYTVWQNKWGVKQLNTNTGKTELMLVNPKTLAHYAKIAKS